MKRSDIQYLEGKLVQRSFRFEELYFEILDHVLCKFEASGSEDVGSFWEQEKLNWSRWKIFKLRVKFHNLMIWQFLKNYFRSLFSFQTKDLKINFVFLIIAAFIGLTFYQNEDLITFIVVCLWFVFPVSFQAWVYHQGDTIGEKSTIFKNKRHGSAKRDALWSIIMANFFSWQIILTEGREYLGLEEFFGLAYHHPIITASIIFLMLVSVRAIYQVYRSQLEPFLL
ncbi:MAG: hypothetical protein ACI9UV_000120 [Algoriphagus sp.]|jgi:hypothetical protein